MEGYDTSCISIRRGLAIPLPVLIQTPLIVFGLTTLKLLGKALPRDIFRSAPLKSIMPSAFPLVT